MTSNVLEPQQGHWSTELQIWFYLSNYWKFATSDLLSLNKFEYFHLAMNKPSQSQVKMIKRQQTLSALFQIYFK